MANPIPPLVCSTPPPIDDFEEISQVDSVDIDFSEYETNTDAEFGSFEGPSLPNTPRHIIKDDSNSIKSNGFKNIEKENEPQNNKTENIETVPIILSDEKLNIEISETSLQNKTNNTENVNIDIEIQKFNNEKLEPEDDKFSNNFELEKLESPPSLEFTLQVISDENDSFEKISNDEKDFYDNSIESNNSESLHKEDLHSPTNLDIEKEDVDIDLNEFIKHDISSNDSDSNADIKNNVIESSPFSPSEASNDIFQVDAIESENNLNQNSDGNLLADDELKENSNTGCEIKNSELLDKNCNQKQNLVFEADFSQFESPVKDTIGTYEENLFHKIDGITSTEENFTICNDEFDSFQGFDEVNNFEKMSRVKDGLDEIEVSSLEDVPQNFFEKLSISNNLPEIKNNSASKESQSDDDFDDEFGEFSTFKETSITETFDLASNNKSNCLNSEIELNNEININDKFKSILEVMFPIMQNCDISKGENIGKSVEEFTQENSIKTNLNQIDSANALEYQWASSNTRHSLIKSLGIDSRNILYGEKWNCSMPRFASNLGFTPLEPLKPAKIESKIQHTSSILVNNLNGTSISSKSNKIPEAEFDWNSSGLTNPLDASHAHTLLLDYDLDQLVVVANLDNIKLDSYSSYLYTSSSSASSTTTSMSTFLSTTTSHCSANTATTTTPTTNVPTATTKNILMNNFDHRWVNVNHDNNVCGTSLGNGSIHNISNLTNFTSINLNYNKNLLMEFGSNQHYAEIINQINANKINNITSMNATNATTNKTYDIMIDYSLSSRNKKRNEEKQDIEIHTTANESSEIDPSVRSSKVQDESIKTNVSTEHEKRTKNSNVHELIDTVSSSNNENNSTELSSITKTKSELTNADDDSTKPKVTTFDGELLPISKTASTSGTEKLSTVDTCLEKNSISPDHRPIIPSDKIANQSAIIENKNTFSDTYLKQHSNYSNDYINIGPSPTTYVVPLKETHIFTPTKSENPISQSTTGGDFIGPNSVIKSIPSLSSGIIESIDFDYETAAAGTVINEKVIKKEYHDVEYDPTKFGLKPLDLDLIENEVNNSRHQKNKDSQNIDITSLDANETYLKTIQDTARTSNWNFHLNNFKDDFKPVINEPSRTQDSENEILNSNKRANPIPFIFSSDPLQNQKTLSNDFVISNESNKEFNGDFKNVQKFEAASVPHLERENALQNLKSSTKVNSSFDDEFTDFQSVLPLPQYKNNLERQKQSSSNIAYQSDKLSEINSALTNKSLKDNTTSRNQTPTLPSDDRMILSPAILLPQAVSVNQSSISSNKTPKIDWPEPGIDNEELARLENIFPQAKPVVHGNAIHSESTTNTNSNIDDDWSDFISAPLPSQNSLQNQQSPKTSNNVSNLNIIYNPQSPTKVSTHRSINQQQNHSNKLNDDDEWSDFISSAPIAQNSSGNFYQTQNIHAPITNHNKWNNSNYESNKQFLPIDQQHSYHNNTLVPSQQQQHGLLNNNNKISKYLLNNASAGNTDNHINSGSNNMQLNSLKPTDFIPHHHIQHQLLQKQQKILSHSTNNSGGNIGNSISFIPDLGFSAPQNQFINMKKRNYPRK